MKNSIRLLIYQSSQPISGLPVRVASDAPTLLTDDEGAVRIAHPGGSLELQVGCADGEWRASSVVALDGAIVVLNLPNDWPLVQPTPGTQSRVELGQRYQFLGLLGEGGMGQVLEAYDRILQRHVAIKLLHDDFAKNAEAQTIFLKEARSLAHLSHPNLIAVHDIIEVEGRGMMVLELVAGQSLEMLAQSPSDDLSKTLALSVQLCDVLSYLHQNALIHRDIKPSNVMLRSDGTIKLIDFGLARRLSELGLRATRIRGTPAYMSPEQLQGGNITPASDVYQLGVTIFELFAGQLPFGENIAMYARLMQAAPRLSTFVEVPDELDELLLYCLATRVEERPQHAGEVLPILQRILTETGTHVAYASVSMPPLSAVGRSSPSLAPLHGNSLRQLSLGQNAAAPAPPGWGDRSVGAAAVLGAIRGASVPGTLAAVVNNTATPAAAAPPANPGEADFHSLLDDAISAMLGKDYKQALRCLQLAASVRPDDAQVNANLTRLRELGFA